MTHSRCLGEWISMKSMPGLQPVQRRQRLAHHQMPRGKVQRHPVLERRVGLDVQVDRHVGLGEELQEAVVVDAVRRVQHVEAVLASTSQRSRCSVEKPMEHDPRRRGERRRIREHDVVDRQRQRPPDRDVTRRRRGRQRIERDHAVEVRRVDQGELGLAPHQIRMNVLGVTRQRLGVPAPTSTHRATRTSRRHRLGPEHHHDVRPPAAHRVEHELGVGPRAVVDEQRLDRARRRAQRADAEEYVCWPTKADPPPSRSAATNRPSGERASPSAASRSSMRAAHSRISSMRALS